MNIFYKLHELEAIHLDSPLSTIEGIKIVEYFFTTSSIIVSGFNKIIISILIEY